MLKGFPMHTKPVKHAKYIEILTKYIRKTRLSNKSILMSTFGQNFDALRSSCMACVIFVMFSTVSKSQKPSIKLKNTCFNHSSLMFFFMTSWNETDIAVSYNLKNTQPKLHNPPHPRWRVSTAFPMPMVPNCSNQCHPPLLWCIKYRYPIWQFQFCSRKL